MNGKRGITLKSYDSNTPSDQKIHPLGDGTSATRPSYHEKSEINGEKTAIFSAAAFYNICYINRDFFVFTLHVTHPPKRSTVLKAPP